MKKFIDNFEEYVIGVFFVIATAIVIVQAIGKFFIPSISDVTAEYSQYIYEFIAFFGIGYCVKRGVDLSIDLFGAFIKGTVLEKFCRLFSKVLYGVAYAILLVGAVQAMMAQIGVTAANSGIPMVLPYFAAVGGFALGLIRWGQGLFGKKKTEEEK
ncbi:MAG: TRAP transporter small permease subunit [Lachnospiraceae bacterium]|nr:TRAP transporter small permease subunit [Lachnospiraceae bacterium]